MMGRSSTTVWLKNSATLSVLDVFPALTGEHAWGVALCPFTAMGDGPSAGLTVEAT